MCSVHCCLILTGSLLQRCIMLQHSGLVIVGALQAQYLSCRPATRVTLLPLPSLLPPSHVLSLRPLTVSVYTGVDIADMRFNPWSWSTESFSCQDTDSMLAECGQGIQQKAAQWLKQSPLSAFDQSRYPHTRRRSFKFDLHTSEHWLASCCIMCMSHVDGC